MSETLNMDLYFKKEYLQHTGRSVCSHYIICTIMLLLILFQVIFLFLLFLGMVMYASEVEATAKKKTTTKLPEIKKLTTAYTLIV